MNKSLPMRVKLHNISCTYAYTLAHVVGTWLYMHMKKTADRYCMST